MSTQIVKSAALKLFSDIDNSSVLFSDYDDGTNIDCYCFSITLGISVCFGNGLMWSNTKTFVRQTLSFNHYVSSPF